MNACTTQSSAFCFVPLGIRYHLQHHIVDLLAAPWVLCCASFDPRSYELASDIALHGCTMSSGEYRLRKSPTISARKVPST